jgi:hypothetical protein
MVSMITLHFGFEFHKPQELNESSQTSLLERQRIILDPFCGAGMTSVEAENLLVLRCLKILLPDVCYAICRTK